MRPEPVVCLLLAFSPQLTASTWSVLFSKKFLIANVVPDIRRVSGSSEGERTATGLGRRVAARSAGVLLDVEGAATWNHGHVSPRPRSHSLFSTTEPVFNS